MRSTRTRTTIAIWRAFTTPATSASRRLRIVTLALLRCDMAPTLSESAETCQPPCKRFAAVAPAASIDGNGRRNGRSIARHRGIFRVSRAGLALRERVAQADRVVAIGAGGDQRDVGLGQLLDRAQVGARGGRQFGKFPNSTSGFLPAREFEIHRFALGPAGGVERRQLAALAARSEEHTSEL